MPSYLLQDDGLSRVLLDDNISFLLLDDTSATRWRVRPHTGGRQLSWEPMAAQDPEAIPVIVSGDDFQGGVVVASSATATMAVMLPDIDPTAPDFQATTWKTDSTTSPPTYRALGPSPSSLSLVAGKSYVIWLKLVDGSGTAVRRVSGMLSIY